MGLLVSWLVTLIAFSIKHNTNLCVMNTICFVSGCSLFVIRITDKLHPDIEQIHTYVRLSADSAQFINRRDPVCIFTKYFFFNLVIPWPRRKIKVTQIFNIKSRTRNSNKTNVCPLHLMLLSLRPQSKCNILSWIREYSNHLYIKLFAIIDLSNDFIYQVLHLRYVAAAVGGRLQRTLSYITSMFQLDIDISIADILSSLVIICI